MIIIQLQNMLDAVFFEYSKFVGRSKELTQTPLNASASFHCAPKTLRNLPDEWVSGFLTAKSDPTAQEMQC